MLEQLMLCTRNDRPDIPSPDRMDTLEDAASVLISASVECECQQSIGLNQFAVLCQYSVGNGRSVSSMLVTEIKDAKRTITP